MVLHIGFASSQKFCTNPDLIMKHFFQKFLDGNVHFYQGLCITNFVVMAGLFLTVKIELSCTSVQHKVSTNKYNTVT